MPTVKLCTIAAITLLLASCMLPSCSERSSEPSATLPTPQADLQTHVYLWSCDSHPSINLSETGICPICGAPTRIRLHLTYRRHTVYFCSDHAGSFESPGKCPVCGREMAPFHGQELVEETREVLRE